MSNATPTATIEEPTTPDAEPTEVGADTHETDDAAARLVDGLVDLGRLWARHGLGVGRASLETSAKSLQATATLLGRLSASLERAPSSAE